MTDNEKAEAVLSGLTPFQAGEDVLVVNESGLLMHNALVLEVGERGQVIINTGFNHWCYEPAEAETFLRRKVK